MFSKKEELTLRNSKPKRVRTVIPKSDRLKNLISLNTNPTMKESLHSHYPLVPLLNSKNNLI